MGLLKKLKKVHFSITDPFNATGQRKTGGDTDAARQQGEMAGRNTQALEAEKDYANIEKNTRDAYTQAARRAGTYADTSEFQSGLGSEVQAGVRGARTEAVRRINALRKAAGNTEEFKPEGFDQTQGNQTADRLAAAGPAPEEEAPQAAVSEAPAQASASATESLQNPTKSGNFASRLKALRQRQY